MTPIVTLVTLTVTNRDAIVTRRDTIRDAAVTLRDERRDASFYGSEPFR